ncbi:AcrR family transcriptional regulator [Nocardioides sp. BE266]|uniref:TetR/AcrR family transcriptional regulator n=1 Tax=Nocardioides sp. BE266 TaxID=2817725 RepID=UPI0028582300|nr:TetR/AcrR family transcriptional regulator [Nocardioides sp. BE266]MDR7252317.1 AcrR family transcriptional regulator [Nocardioides sp. BE266]
MAAPGPAYVSDLVAPGAARPSKHDSRRDQLAESALMTLGELGYARTTLRDIAQNSPFSHGVVHYYFSSKEELILYCVRYYERTCVTRYDGVVQRATTAEEMRSGLIAKVEETIREEAPLHQLWYDLRNQAMFEPALRDVVLDIDAQLQAMVWRIVTRYAELAGQQPLIDSSACYAIFDGLFAQTLLAWAAGPEDRRERALEALTGRVDALLPTLFA